MKLLYCSYVTNPWVLWTETCVVLQIHVFVMIVGGNYYIHMRGSNIQPSHSQITEDFLSHNGKPRLEEDITFYWTSCK